MSREEFITKSNEKLKLIRTEFGYTQEKMAEILGMSKKTLVQIEKGRATLGWMGAVTLCTIFENSEIVDMTFGGQPTDIIMALAYNGEESLHSKTMGGKIWWAEIEIYGDYKIQQNIISKHFRILDGDKRRIYSSFNVEQARKRFKEICGR